MKSVARLALILLGFCVAATQAVFADTIACPGPVNHVHVEFGHNKPIPALIIPDVGADGEAPWQEWNNLNKKSDGPVVVVHCFPKKSNADHSDVVIPLAYKKCIFVPSDASVKGLENEDGSGQFLCRKEP
jgi:hypothetical protein